MKNYPHPIIAREGWLFLGLFLVVSILVTIWGGLWSLPLWLLTFFTLQFFRDPARQAPENDRAVLAPADGRVVVVERTQDIYGNREALKISVFMSVFNVHSNRSPVDGEIEKIAYFPGQFFNASLDKASLSNERNALLIRAGNGEMVTCVQIAGLVARRILCYAEEGGRLQRGQRFGFIRFGSRVDVYLPLTAQPKVAVGDKVYATETVLAEFRPV
ncbi:MAG: phosphatidylserine decarboxylase [Alistipes senegalensis]|nr:phosphatidylserine decarboxylase [Oxalobacter formigenes]MCM1281446.1 phosphatidylserine decarboxylase [Alistipes senegalensis]